MGRVEINRRTLDQCWPVAGSGHEVVPQFNVRCLRARPHDRGSPRAPPGCPSQVAAARTPSGTRARGETFSGETCAVAASAPTSQFDRVFCGEGRGPVRRSDGVHVEGLRSRLNTAPTRCRPRPGRWFSPASGAAFTGRDTMRLQLASGHRLREVGCRQRLGGFLHYYCRAA